MKRSEWIRRYLVLTLGLAVCSVGVVFSTKSGLGSSPVSSVPYTLSLIIPAVTMGTWTTMVNLLLIFGQWVLSKGKMKPMDAVMQMAASAVFGWFIDLSMVLFGWLTPEAYPLRLLCLLLGCAILGFGISLQLMANVAMLAMEAFAKLVAKLRGSEYGNVKVFMDSSMVLLAAVLCLLFRGKLDGVREGTIIAALCVGTIVKFIRRHTGWLEKILLPQAVESK